MAKCSKISQLIAVSEMLKVCGILFILIGSTSTQISLRVKKNLPPEVCPENDVSCLDEKQQYEAIKHIHKQIDDDKDGNVDLEESDEFLRSELQYEDSFERHELFHNHDKLISVDDLWLAWKYSTVYNWTVDDVVEWLETSVELPQYTKHFRKNNVDGKQLPRLAANLNYKTGVIGMKNPIHKQRLSLKAVDAVLFGPPGKGHSYWKDLALVTSLVVAVGGTWLAVVQNRHSKRHIARMSQDLAELQRAEEELKDMHRKLRDAEARADGDSDDSRELGSEEVERLRLVEEELEQTQLALQRAETMLANSGGSRWKAPPNLQLWLQLTHEIETQYYQMKRAAAEKSLQVAKEGCERVKKKRSGFMGTIRIAHDSSMDEVDRRILLAKSALEEVSRSLDERQQRWRNIEVLCDFGIMNNPGITQLEATIHSEKTQNSGSTPLDADDAEEESFYHKPNNAMWRLRSNTTGSANFSANSSVARPNSLTIGSIASASIMASDLGRRVRHRLDEAPATSDSHESVTPADSASQVGNPHSTRFVPNQHSQSSVFRVHDWLNRPPHHHMTASSPLTLPTSARLAQEAKTRVTPPMLKRVNHAPGRSFDSNGKSNSPLSKVPTSPSNGNNSSMDGSMSGMHPTQPSTTKLKDPNPTNLPETSSNTENRELETHTNITPAKPNLSAGSVMNSPPNLTTTVPDVCSSANSPGISGGTLDVISVKSESISEASTGVLTVEDRRKKFKIRNLFQKKKR